jgi:hypothetical protein
MNKKTEDSITKEMGGTAEITSATQVPEVLSKP